MANQNPKDFDAFSTRKSQFTQTTELNKEPPNPISKTGCCRKKHPLTKQANEENSSGPENQDHQERNKEQLNIPSTSNTLYSSARKNKMTIERSSSLIEVGGRKVVKTEIALVKIVFFDDRSKTFEIMNGPFQDKLQKKATHTSAIFVVQPEGFAMCFECGNTCPKYSDIMFRHRNNIL